MKGICRRRRGSGIEGCRGDKWRGGRRTDIEKMKKSMNERMDLDWTVGTNKRGRVR